MTTRRNFLAGAAAAGTALLLSGTKAIADSGRKDIIKPPALTPGDTIGLITPASRLFEAHRTLIEAKEKMQSLGFKVKTGKNIFKKNGYLAGTIEERAADIHDMFADDAVQAIMCIRGGYGSAQLLPHLDYKLIERNPKILIGYSDVTSLLIGIHKMTGLITFHGPVAISTFTEFTKKCFFEVLCETVPSDEIGDPPFENDSQLTNQVWTYRPGTAEGRLTGGNMTLLQTTLATPYELDTDDSIIFIEEVDEQPYDLDRMLHHFKMAGKFDKCRGVFFNKMKSIKPKGTHSLSMEEIIDNVFKEYDFPVCAGLPFGHVKEKLTLPIGIKIKLDADKGRIAFLEAAVS